MRRGCAGIIVKVLLDFLVRAPRQDVTGWCQPGIGYSRPGTATTTSPPRVGHMIHDGRAFAFAAFWDGCSQGIGTCLPCSACAQLHCATCSLTLPRLILWMCRSRLSGQLRNQVGAPQAEQPSKPFSRPAELAQLGAPHNTVGSHAAATLCGHLAGGSTPRC